MPPPAPAARHGAQRVPPGRYDPPSRFGARVLAMLLGALVLALVVAAVWMLYQRFGSSQVRANVRTFTVVSDTLVQVDFDVVPPADRPAYCLVRARDASGAEAGRTFVTVPPAQQGRRVVTVSSQLTTRSRAVTGEVTRCLLTPPPPAPSP